MFSLVSKGFEIKMYRKGRFATKNIGTEMKFDKKFGDMLEEVNDSVNFSIILVAMNPGVRC